ncbi:MAG: glycoside hydrolase family 140 protein [Haliscomenobacter sp.]|uniref:glycoside hydrolase family 140 protein n=1 Tax=Haliscomenobacter sp. TaxID=2717303 RepID=UPI0029AD4195|nr:glycoside hydrolase family 140 protein [Haliscomenobacter sp.]MDX2071591.1 glycoside hydrolase family 140 protein [Haliscomenobacter sp.]
MNTCMKLQITLLTFLLTTIFSSGGFAQILKVSQNGRFLVQQDGKPFFYLGDTAWELFHRLNREEADLYLTNRAKKGFTVIQAVVLAEQDGLNAPNPYGETPLMDNDPTKPNEQYFKHVDYIVDKATSLGLVIGMLPTWGAYWSSLNPDKTIFNTQNAFAYGRYLGQRYKQKPIIWILGGDRDITNDGERKMMEAMAQGLKAGDGGSHLITFHPRGPGLSSDYFHNAPWLDFNMYQSSHAAHDHDNGLYAEHDYKLMPPKPTLDGEPRYERIPAGFYFAGSNPQDRFDDYDSRQAAYWSVLSGACGHTYGNNNIWQMYAEKHKPVIAASIPWFEAIDHPGAFQMGILKKLFTSRQFQKLAPSKTIVLDGPDTGGGKIKAALANDGSFTIVYSPRGEKFTIDKSLLKADRMREVWFDPRYGEEYIIHTSGTKGIQTYTPPTNGRGNDWILIIEKVD